MNSPIIRNILGLLGLLILQIVVLNHMGFSSFVVPFVYILFVLSLRRSFSRVGLLLAGFFIGLIVDFYTNTGGAHAMACTFMAYVRPFFLTSLSPKDSASDQIIPSVHSMNFSNYAMYLLLLTFIHHLLFFSIEIFSMKGIVSTILRILISTGVSVLIMLILQFIFIKKRD